jgi:tetratricopeptide (TPR) repeat protein
MENPHIESLNLRGSFFDNFLSISISCMLIIIAIIWLTVRLWSGNFRCPCGGLELGILIFVIACVISTIAASNRRAAITDSITILSAMLTAGVLAQIMDSAARKKILLFAIIAIGVANVYQCSEQFFSSNKLMIEQYEAEPTTQLEILGIEPGSFQQMLYEHRLYSKDVRGFFTTGNSVASFLVLAIFCTFAVFDFRTGKRLLPIILLLVLFAGLLEAHSKGAILSLAAAGFLLFLAVRFGKILYRRRALIIPTAVFLIVLCAVLITGYGITHNTLPGGNSMLVRWQYWSATAEIIVNHLLTGIGGGNFGTYYARYKIPESLETIRDPHCFILSILSQYGIIGLAGFLTALFYPIIRVCIQNKPSIKPDENNISAIAKAYGISAVLVLLFVRPLVVRTEIGDGIEVILYILTITYAAPAFFFGATLWLCARNEKLSEKQQIYRAGLLCGLAAVLIHNLIDFAIFEPGIMTALWACIAVIYSDCHEENATDRNLNPNKAIKFILTILAAALVTVIIRQCIIPGAKTAIKTEEANLLFNYGKFEEATALLSSACADDVLNPTPAAITGKMLLQTFKMNPGNRPDILLKAEKNILTAILRNRADFKNYENLAEVYETLAQITPEKRQFWFEKSFWALQEASSRYPASAELYIKLAKTAQELNKIDFAIECYKKAVEIEDAYTGQFKIMYPGKEVFSRLDKVEYRSAKEKLEELTQIKQNQKK